MSDVAAFVEILKKGSVVAAPEIIGWRLYAREPDGALVGGMIIETEAYLQEDAASHTYHGKTVRNQTMFLGAGHVYVYFTYGMHWCMNFVTGDAEHGQGVLIRAVKPEKGIEIMRARRNGLPDAQLTDGPAKVCQALGVSGSDNGMYLGDSEKFILLPPLPEVALNIQATERIGIKKDTHRLWRFVAV